MKVGNQIFYVTGVNYERKRTRTMVRVNHPDPIAKTRGSNEYTGDIEMLLAEFNALQAALILLAQQASGAAPVGYGDVPFQVVVSYTENGLDTITDTMIGCTMDSTSASNSEGTEPTKRKFDLAPLKIYYNGVDDLGVPLKAPPGG